MHMNSLEDYDSYTSLGIVSSIHSESRFTPCRLHGTHVGGVAHLKTFRVQTESEIGQHGTRTES